MPDTLEAAQTQHQRWERGRIDLARRTFRGCSIASSLAALPGGTRTSYAALDVMIPPFSVVVALESRVDRSPRGPMGGYRGRRQRALAILGVARCATLTAYVLSTLRMVEASPAVYRSLLGAPRLVGWKVRLWLAALGRQDSMAWRRTTRNVADAQDGGSASIG